MRDALLKYFGPQEKTLIIAGDKVVVRTLSDETETAPFKEAGADNLWLFVVRCTFHADGEHVGKPAFEDADIPVLKAAPKMLTLPLIRAVEDVNGFNAFTEVKNSEAAPSAG